MNSLLIDTIIQIIEEKEKLHWKERNGVVWVQGVNPPNPDIFINKEKVTNIRSYFPRERFSDIKNPRLKMGHPIIQPRGQNH